MPYLLMAIVLAFAVLLSGVSVVGKPFSSPPAASVEDGGDPGVSVYGPCIPKKQLEEILAQEVTLRCNNEEYVLAARNVKVEKVYYYEQKKLAERAVCDGIRYYSWLCHPPDYGSLWQNTLWKSVPDPKKSLSDGDTFDVYLKKNPDENALFICPEQSDQKPAKKSSSVGTTFVTFAAKEDETRTIRIGNKEGTFAMSGTSPSVDIESAPTRKKIDSIIVKTGTGDVAYDVWVNLLRAYSPDEGKAFYLVEKGQLPESNAVPPSVTYKKYYVTRVFASSPERESLQLETFKILPTPKTRWWEVYLPESKPVIYLYPQSETKINVKVKPTKGSITVSYPYYPNGGWDVISDEKSRISYNNALYPYLYFETEVAGYDIPENGYVYKKEDLEPKLKKLVTKLGLKDREISEFVDYWVKRINQDIESDYVFVSVIPQEEIDKVIPLEISPQPDKEIRVRLYFKGVEKGYGIKPPTLPVTPQRNGFTVVEWGGILEEAN